MEGQAAPQPDPESPESPETRENPASPEGQSRLLLDFLNTRDLEAGTDTLDTTAGYHAWLVDHGLPPRGDCGPARAVRDALRAAAAGDGSLGAALGGVPLSAALEADGHPVLVSPDPLGHILVVTLALAGDGRWRRIRLCPAGDCEWAFYDRSKNRSRQWCSMSICGNRTKGRAFRARQRDATV